MNHMLYFILNAIVYSYFLWKDHDLISSYFIRIKHLHLLKFHLNVKHPFLQMNYRGIISTSNFFLNCQEENHGKVDGLNLQVKVNKNSNSYFKKFYQKNISFSTFIYYVVLLENCEILHAIDNYLRSKDLKIHLRAFIINKKLNASVT